LLTSLPKPWTVFLTSFVCLFESFLRLLIIFMVGFWILSLTFNQFIVLGFRCWVVAGVWRWGMSLVFHF
jgi:hypothetical protein